MIDKIRFTKVFLEAAGKDPVDESQVKKRMPFFWYNQRSLKSGFRLTDCGLEFIIENDIRHYEIKLPDDFKISAQVLIWLDRRMRSPYHLTKEKITVLGEVDALEIHLFSGDIKKMGFSKSLAARFNGE